MLVTVNDKLKFEIEIVHDLLCHPIFLSSKLHSHYHSTTVVADVCWLQEADDDDEYAVDKDQSREK